MFPMRPQGHLGTIVPSGPAGYGVHPDPAAGRGGAAPGAAAAPGPAPFIPDAQYLAAAAQAAFQRNQQIEQLTQEGATDRTNATTALNRLVADAPQQRQGIREGANKEGLFYSGQLTKRLADYEQNLQRAQDDINTPLSQRENARQAAITALRQGAPIEDAQMLADAAGRQIASDTTAADAGALAPPAPSTPAPAAVSAAQKLIQSRGPVVQTIPAPGGVIKVHANGQRVFVARR